MLENVSVIPRRYTPVAQRWALAPVSTGGTTELPVSLADLKQAMRIDVTTSTGEDDLISGYGRTAAARLENEYRVVVLRKQFDLALDLPPAEPVVNLPMSPLVSVDRISSIDRDGVETAMSSSGYYVDAISQPGRVGLMPGFSWPSSLRDAAGLVIRFTAGASTSASGVPDPMATAVKQLAAFLYERRGDEPSELPRQIHDLMADYLVPEAG